MRCLCVVLRVLGLGVCVSSKKIECRKVADSVAFGLMA